MKRFWRLMVPTGASKQPLKTAQALVFGLALFSSSLASAQVVHLSTWIGGKFPYSQWNQPTAAEGGRLNCAPGTADCVPLNLAACEDSAPARPISFSVNPPAAGQSSTFTGSNQIVYAFLSTSPSCVYSQQVGGQNNNPNFLIGTSSGVPSSSVFFGGSTPFKLGNSSGSLTLNPSLTSTVPGELTTKDILRAFNVCPNLGGVAQQLQTYYVCIGLDADSTNGVNNTASTTQAASTTPQGSAPTASGADPFQYIQFQIDTLPPETPNSLSLTPLDGRVEVNVHFTSSDLDVQLIRILATSDPVNLPTVDAKGTTVQDCSTWTGKVSTFETSVQGSLVGNVAYTFHTPNGQIAQVCARSVDYLGNASTPTATQSATPRAECDLFECYPGELTTGFCVTGMPASYWAAAVGAALLRSARARRRHRAAKERDLS